MRRGLAIGIILMGVFVLAPAAWIGTIAAFTAVAWALWESGIQVLSGASAVPLGGLCGMVMAFLTAVACGLVARWLWTMDDP